MSADNGIYILKTPAPPIKNGNYYESRNGVFEWRVAECQAIENIDYSDLYLPLLFGNSPVYTSYDDAFKVACNMEKEIDDEGFPLEYGICDIVKECFFPNITVRAAQRALDCYVGAVKLDDHLEFMREKLVVNTN